MRQISSDHRALIGCGFLPAHKLSRPWRHRGTFELDYPEPTVCPGYSTKLPEVVEVARTRLHWSKGNVSVDSLEENVQRGVEILESAIGDMNEWALKDRTKK